MTPEEAEQLQAENDALRAEIKLLTECRETQTHNWRADQFEKSRLNRKVGKPKRGPISFKACTTTHRHTSPS